MSVASTWKLIHEKCEQLERQNPQACRFGKPATQSELDSLSEFLAVELPRSFLESLRIHNGCEWIPSVGRLASTHEIAKQHAMYLGWQKEGFGRTEHTPTLDPLMKAYFWGPKRVFVTCDDSGEHIGLDLDPAEDGTFGQAFMHGHEYGPGKVLSPDWAEFLDDYVLKHLDGLS